MSKILNEKIQELENHLSAFENSSGAGEIDFEDETMREQLLAMSDDDIEEVKSSLHVLDMFYSGTFAG